MVNLYIMSGLKFFKSFSGQSVGAGMGKLFSVKGHLGHTKYKGHHLWVIQNY